MIKRIFFPALVLCLVIVSICHSASIDNHLITGDPRQGSGCATPALKTTFSPTDSRAYFWVLFSNALPIDTLVWKWFAPDNSLYDTSQTLLGVAGAGCAWTSIVLQGQPAATKQGNWRAEVYLGNLLAASDPFKIGTTSQLCNYTYSDWSACQPNNTQTRMITSSVPSGCVDWVPVLTQSCTYVPPSSGAPKVTFIPAATTQIAAGLAFDFTFNVDFGTHPQLNSFSFAFQDIDLTSAFLSVLQTGYIKVNVTGSMLKVTLPGIALPSGQYKITVGVSSPGGATKADWIVSVTSSARYTLSEDQKALITSNGYPQYLAIVFNSSAQRREETWTFTTLNKMYAFWDGVRVTEQSISPDPSAYSNPPSIDPSLFTKNMLLSDLTQVFGNSYTTAVASDIDAGLQSLNFKTYYFVGTGLFASFLDDKLVVVHTNDMPQK